MPSEKFKTCVIITLRLEGNYTNVGGDAGGETKYGIAKHTHPDLNIKALTKDQAKEIYYREYWNKYYDLIPFPLVFKVFDMGVLFGHKPVIRALQKAIVKRTGLTLAIDGIFGPMTSTALTVALNRTVSEVGYDEKLVIYADLLQALRTRVKWICVIKPWNLKFKKGWLNRINYDSGLNEGLVI